MLSRVADAIYWMSRYLERAGNIARFLDVNWHLTLDTPGVRAEQWAPLVRTMGDWDAFTEQGFAPSRNDVIRFLAFDAQSPNSIYACPYRFCEAVKLRDLTISGIAGDAMSHDEAWDFFRLGLLLERADKTSRMLDVKYFILLPHPSDVGSNLDYVQWAALLKAISALEA